MFEKVLHLIKFLMIFISLMGGVWFAACTWWNHLYKCQVGPLAWDLGEISRALMNIGHVHDLVVQHSDSNKDCGGVLWLVDNYHTPSVFGSYNLLHQLYCVLIPISLGLVHIYIYMQSYPARALYRRLQVDWTRDAREGPRVLMSLRIDFGPMN